MYLISVSVRSLTENEKMLQANSNVVGLLVVGPLIIVTKCILLSVCKHGAVAPLVFSMYNFLIIQSRRV